MGNSPAATITLTPATQALDIQVVAGKSYVFTADAGQVAVYERKPNFSTKPESNIPKGEHLVLVKTLDLPTIFNPLYGPDDPAHPRPHNVNALLARVWNWRPNPQNPNDPRYGPIPCFVEDPFDWRGALFAGNNLYKSGPDGQPASPPPALDGSESSPDRGAAAQPLSADHFVHLLTLRRAHCLRRGP